MSVGALRRVDVEVVVFCRRVVLSALDKIDERKRIGFLLLMRNSEFFKEKHFIGIHLIAGVILWADFPFVSVAIHAVPCIAVVFGFEQFDAPERAGPPGPGCL